MSLTEVDPVAMTRDLVAIRSHVGSGVNEVGVAEYVEAFLRDHTPFAVSRQPVSGARYNVVARSDDGPVELLLGGHMDTVDPKSGWANERDQYAGVIEGGIMYGLGALDMKSGIASILAAAASLDYMPRGLELLFYCDEEYDFEGMRRFIEAHEDPPPKRCVIPEPTDLRIRNEQRGLVELHLIASGKTGHSSNPGGGVNAIDGLYTVVSDLRGWLTRYETPSLGVPTVNVAFFRGGLRPAEKSEDPREKLGREGNNIADWAEAVIEVRTTTEDCRARPIVERMTLVAETARITLEPTEYRHDLGSMNVPREELAFIEDALRRADLAVHYTDDAATRGYSDCAMLRDAWGIPVSSLGPVGQGMHAVDECVEVHSIIQLTAAMKGLMDACCGG